MQTVALPVVSAIAAGVLIVGQMALMLITALRRRSTGQALGDGDAALQRSIRRHGNYAENAAIFVASLTLLEMLGAVRPFVIGLATLFILGRLLHAIGLSQENTVNAWRVTGVIATISGALATATEQSETLTGWGAGISTALASNLANNLPIGLIAGSAVQDAHASAKVTSAVLIGVDIGPNLSVTGSLATILWLTALRRDGHQVGAIKFLKIGAIVMPPALFLALGAELLFN